MYLSNAQGDHKRNIYLIQLQIDKKKLVIKKVFFYLQATSHPWEVQTDWSVVKVPVCPEAMASCLLSFAEKREGK